MEKFTTAHRHRGPAASRNVDTDQIIPAVYLKRVTQDRASRTRSSRRGGKDPDFVLNQPAVHARVACSSPGPTSAPAPPASTPSGRCGTTASGPSWRPGSPTSSAATRASRACWPPRSSQEDIELIWKVLEANPGTEVTVDLVRASASPAATSSRPFEIDDYTRWRLLEGLDDIGLTLQHEDEITEFEAHARGLAAEDPPRQAPAPGGDQGGPPGGRPPPHARRGAARVATPAPLRRTRGCGSNEASSTHDPAFDGWGAAILISGARRAPEPAARR